MLLEQIVLTLVVLVLGLSSLVLVSKFKREEVGRALLKIVEKIWGGRSPDEVLAKRFKLFVLIAVTLITLSKLLYLKGITFPNFELIIPTLVVVGSFPLYCGPTKFWSRLTRYFGIIALISVFLIDLAFWGPRYIYAFTWSGFVLAWFLGMRNRLSVFGKFKTLVGHTVLTAAIAILLFDLWTGVIGTPLMGWYGPVTSLTPWLTAFLGQIPFTFYHLCSLVFVPPLVGLGKMLARVKVPVSVAVPAGVKTSSSQRR